jgi:NAD(P)-dependent dehydrogenase (short-subunit alcohol dehydrogenase family)
MNAFFNDKVALVTGTGSGIGLATVRAFAEAGAAVVLADVHENAIRSASGLRAPLGAKNTFMFNDFDETTQTG